MKKVVFFISFQISNMNVSIHASFNGEVKRHINRANEIQRKNGDFPKNKRNRPVAETSPTCTTDVGRPALRVDVTRSGCIRFASWDTLIRMYLCKFLNTHSRLVWYLYRSDEDIFAGERKGPLLGCMGIKEFAILNSLTLLPVWCLEGGRWFFHRITKLWFGVKN